MKKVVIMLILFLFFAGVVSASSINGDYNGKPIVIMKSDGKELYVMDAPAVIMDNRTMIPIYMLRQIGLEVEWNPDEFSVNLSIPKQVSIDTDELKTYLLALDYYAELRNLFNISTSLQFTYQLTYFYIVDNVYTVKDSLERVLDTLNMVIDSYNNIHQEEITLKSSLQHYGVNDIYISASLNHFYNAIDYYKLAYDNLNEFSNGDTTALVRLTNNLDLAGKENSNAYSLVNSGYDYIINVIQNN